jgi:nicotinate-nucleotide adenylyltransferase
MNAETLVGLFGGTFNPVHNGHLRLARAAADSLGLQKLIFIPSAIPPHKDLAGDTAPKHRLRMVELAIQGDPLFEVSGVEVSRGGPSYTLTTLQQMHRKMPGARFVFLIGADAWLEIGAWHRVQDVLPLADWALMRRPGFDLGSDVESLGELSSEFEEVAGAFVHKDSGARIFDIDLPLIDISSSAIRQKIQSGESIRGMTPQAVVEYIERENLYSG